MVIPQSRTEADHLSMFGTQTASQIGLTTQEDKPLKQAGINLKVKTAHTRARLCSLTTAVSHTMSTSLV